MRLAIATPVAALAAGWAYSLSCDSLMFDGEEYR